MNADQIWAMSERIIYGVAMAVAMKLVAAGWLESADAPWLAGGIVAAIGGFIGWIKSRPANLLSRAASTLPAKADVVVVTSPSASAGVKKQVTDITNQASDRVTSSVQ